MKNEIKVLATKLSVLSTELSLLEQKLIHLIQGEDDGDCAPIPTTPLPHTPPAPASVERLWDNQDLSFYLNVSICTLQRYRAAGLLPNRSLKKKNYYLNSDVLHCVEQMKSKKNKKGKSAKEATK